MAYLEPVRLLGVAQMAMVTFAALVVVRLNREKRPVHAAVSLLIDQRARA